MQYFWLITLCTLHYKDNTFNKCKSGNAVAVTLLWYMYRYLDLKDLFYLACPSLSQENIDFCKLNSIQNKKEKEKKGTNLNSVTSDRVFI